MAFAMSPHSPLSSKLQRRGRTGDDGSGTLLETGIRNLNRHKDKDNGALPLARRRWKEREMEMGREGTCLKEDEKFIRSEQLDLLTVLKGMCTQGTPPDRDRDRDRRRRRRLRRCRRLPDADYQLPITSYPCVPFRIRKKNERWVSLSLH